MVANFAGFTVIFFFVLAGTGFPQSWQDPPADQHYDLQMLTKGGWGGYNANQVFVASNMTNGPAGEAEDDDLIKGHTMDANGSVYWSSSPYPVLRQYDKTRNWISTIGGSVAGHLDGPLERARFNGWSYNNTNLISASDDGKHLFIMDRLSSKWRYIDLDSGMVSTIGAYTTAGTYLIIAKDCRSGNIYAFKSNGTDAPDCKGYTKLSTAAWKVNAWFAFDGISLDVTAMKFYFHCRGRAIAVDLLAGDTSFVSPAGWCPTGMSLSPSGRYLYVGGGDDMWCWRYDLQTSTAHKLGNSTGGVDGQDILFRADGTDYRRPLNTSSAWPSTVVFSTNGTTGVWATCWGLFTMVPRN